MSPHGNLRARFVRVKGVFRRLCAIVFVLLIALAGVAWFLTRPERLARITAGILADVTGGEVSIETAHLNWDGSIRLERPALRLPRESGDAARLFTADRIDVDHSILSLLRGAFRVNSLTLDHPTIYLTQAADGTYNYAKLQPPKPATPGQRPQVPEVFLKQAVIQFAELDTHGTNKFAGKLELSGSMVSLQSSPDTFKFVLAQEGIGSASKPKLTGQFNLATQAIEAKLTDLAIAPEHREMLPLALRKSWDTYKPAGTMPEVVFSYDPARMPRRKASLTLTRGEMDLGLERQGVRMTNVSGDIELADEAVTVRTLSGRVADIDYTIEGHIDGFTKDAPFALKVQLHPFVLPEKPTYLIAMNDQVQTIFRRFAPSGHFTATVAISRDKPKAGEKDAEIRFSGTARVAKGKLKYKGFPYPLDELGGELQFDNDKVVLKNMQGRGPTGARVRIDATIAPPVDGASLDMTVRVDGMPLDEHLRKCMYDWQVTRLDQFMDTEAYERWQKLNLLQSSKTALARKGQLTAARERRRKLAESKPPPEASALAAADKEIQELDRLSKLPVFDLGGSMNMDVRVTRARGMDTDYVTDILLEVAGTGAIFKQWPYPLRLTGGKVHITDDGVVIEAVECDGLTGLRGSIDGTIRSDKDRTTIPDVKVRASRAPLDELMLGTIRPPKDAIIRAAGLEAVLDMSGTVFLNENKEIDFSLDVGITNGKARPLGGRVNLTDLKAKATISGEGVIVHNVTAKRGDATLAITGSTRWDGPDAGVNAKVQVKDLTLDETLVDLLPKNLEATAQARSALEKLKPEGVINGSLSYKSKPQGTPEYRATVEPRWLAFDFRKQRIKLTDLKGSATLTSRGVRLDGVSAVAGPVTFAVDGLVGPGSKPELDLSFSAKSRTIDPLTRTVLPASVVKVIDDLALETNWELTGATLKRAAEKEGDQAAPLDFAGKLRLTGATATVGLPITEASGAIDLRVVSTESDTPPRIDANIAVDSMRVAKRKISPLSAKIVSDERPGILLLRDLKGKMYGGDILATGDVDTRRDGRYRVQLSLSEVALDGVLRPEDYERATPQPGATTAPATAPDADAKARTGKVMLALALEGIVGKSDTRKGRGQLEIREANLYELPSVIAILQLIQFTLPTGRTVSSAASEFLIDDDIVRFEAIKFTSPALEMTGAGTMRYSTTALDIDLRSRNPSAPDLGVIGKVFTVMKDQLFHIHVGGTLSEPKASLRPLGGLQKAAEEREPPGKGSQRAGDGAARVSNQ